MILRNYVFVTSHGTRQDSHYFFLIVFLFFSVLILLCSTFLYRLPASRLFSVQLILLLFLALPPNVQLVSSNRTEQNVTAFSTLY